MILVTSKQEVERKSEWFCGVNFFRSNFKVKWENGVWTKIRFLTLIFCFFDFLDRIFFLNGFSNPFIVHSRSSFLFSQWKFFELYVRTCPAMFFLFRRRDFCYDHMTSQPLQVCFLFIRSCNFNWNACVTSFFALSGASFLFICVIKFLVTLNLPHSQKWLPHFEIDFYLL